MDTQQIDVMVADASHEVYVDTILETIRNAAAVRGTGIAERTHEYVATKMKEGKAIIAYIDRTGDLKFEANLEYRFPILGDLHGATFLDSGNIWLIRNDPDRPGGQLKWGSFLKDLALGTGFGLRYDLTFIVIRFDASLRTLLRAHRQ